MNLVRNLIFTLPGMALSFYALPLKAAEPPKPFLETQTLRIEAPGPYDDLGYSLGAGGGSLIAGAINVQDSLGQDVGAAYVYERNSSGNWIEAGVLQPDDGQHNDAFGWDADAFGQTAIVGVPFHGNSSGAAYLFANRSAAGWQQVDKLVAPDGEQFELFGLDVDYRKCCSGWSLQSPGLASTWHATGAGRHLHVSRRRPAELELGSKTPTR
jgi:hypothetical protein